VADIAIGTVRVRRNSAVTRGKILATATTEFAAKGFEGARVDEIALQAGANKNMIYHYFGSKDGLFQAVLEQMYRTIRNRHKDLEIRSIEPVEGMRVLVLRMFDVFGDFPQFISLLQSENLAEARHIKTSHEVREMYDPLIATLKDLLHRGTDAGVFRSDIDPIDLYVSMAALSTYHISNQHTLSALFGTNIGSVKAVRKRRAHVLDMALRFVMKAPEGTVKLMSGQARTASSRRRRRSP
jgi:TetR/AcrR family transcriptional regulator